MQVSITGRHVEISDALREHTHGKLEQALADFQRLDSVHVILNVEKHRCSAELVIKAPNHVHVEAREETNDMYLAIDAAIDKAERQLRKWHDKVQDHKAKESIAEVDRAVQAGA